MGLCLVASSCANGLAFTKDERLTITSPRSHEHVSLPVTISWRVSNFRITGPDGASDPDAGYFGVFIDRTPVPPGKPLSWIARDDRRCARVPGCPDTTYLADRRVHSTSDTSFTFEHLPDLGAYRGRERHEVTVVLLDGSGKRIGESAWFVAFKYDRAL
jgi:hypothetical protein